MRVFGRSAPAAGMLANLHTNSVCTGMQVGDTCLNVNVCATCARLYVHSPLCEFGAQVAVRCASAVEAESLRIRAHARRRRFRVHTCALANTSAAHRALCSVARLIEPNLVCINTHAHLRRVHMRTCALARASARKFARASQFEKHNSDNYFIQHLFDYADK